MLSRTALAAVPLEWLASLVRYCLFDLTEASAQRLNMRLFAGTPFDIPPKCERCGKLVEGECQCVPLADYKPPEKQTAKLRVEKRPKGKVVTLVTGLAAASNDLPDLLKQLKNACGAGGVVKDDSLEIQGDHLERVKQQLLKIGYKVK